MLRWRLSDKFTSTTTFLTSWLLSQSTTSVFSSCVEEVSRSSGINPGGPGEVDVISNAEEIEIVEVTENPCSHMRWACSQRSLLCSFSGSAAILFILHNGQFNLPWCGKCALASAFTVLIVGLLIRLYSSVIDWPLLLADISLFVSDVHADTKPFLRQAAVAAASTFDAEDEQAETITKQPRSSVWHVTRWSFLYYLMLSCVWQLCTVLLCPHNLSIPYSEHAYCHANQLHLFKERNKRPVFSYSSCLWGEAPVVLFTPAVNQWNQRWYFIVCSWVMIIRRSDNYVLTLMYVNARFEDESALHRLLTAIAQF